MTKWPRYLIFAWILLIPFLSFAESAAPSTPVAVTLAAEETAIQAERPFWALLSVNLEKGWHAYWKNPGDSGMPLDIQWTLPEGFTVENIEWPSPQRTTLNAQVAYGYSDQALFLVKIVPAKNINPQSDLQVKVTWVACSDTTCLPGESEAKLTVNHADSSQKDSEKAALFAQARAKIPQASAAQALRHDQLIEVELHAQDVPKEALSQIYFCPEDPTAIDDRAETQLIPVPDIPNRYRLLLKDKGEARQVKGVLVMGDRSFAIDSPINDPDSSLLSMVDGDEIPSASADEQPALSFSMALVLAFFGGLILNLMPCVLPVVSFKILSFVKLAGECRVETFKHGLMFAFGVLLSFWTLAGTLLLLQAYGQSVGWGFQLQEPLFVALLAALMLLFGLSMFGVFEMGTLFASLAGRAKVPNDKEGLFSSFFSGVLATAVATPCTGPFLGTAVGFAVTLQPIGALTIFTFLGLGMALPYLLLSAFPALLRWMPRPGPWMESFKQFMGFLMVATVLWLLWVFSGQTNPLALFILMAAFFVLSIGSWVLGRWGTPVKRKKVRMVGLIVAIICFAFAGNLMLQASRSTSIMQSDSQLGWEPFSQARVQELRQKGIPVFIDFTAKWCLICQANHLVLATQQVEKEMEKQGVVRMKADWTKKDPAITEELRKFGRNSVPLYVYYDKDGEAEILPQVLTPEIVTNSIKKTQEPNAIATP